MCWQCTLGKDLSSNAAPESKDGRPALAEASSSSSPSSHTPNCKTTVYQIGSSLWAGEALGRAGKSYKAHWHDSGPDIELDIKKTFDEENYRVSSN